MSGHTKEYWIQRAREAEARLDSAQLEIEALESECEALQQERHELLMDKGERDRYRAALERIVEVSVDEGYDIAREALGDD